jgi:hypothetical protein
MNLEQLVKQHIEQDVNTVTTLCETYKKYGSDKSTYHNYSALYKKIFDTFADREINFLEVGLGTNNLDVKSNMGRDGKPGASLYTISEMYPLWNIFGLDIDDRILFQDRERKIQTFFVDQTDETTIQQLCDNQFKDIKFDIMIDDGLHKFHANKTLFDNSFHMLNEGGYYIIEDIVNKRVRLYEDMASDLGYEYQSVRLPHSENTRDNNLFIIRK